ncbi:hypothetical protein J6590_081983 [Homalodisca vitripennis]|nr:hypothetical protein J6590_081983 [Homalodisca vitripennis]
MKYIRPGKKANQKGKRPKSLEPDAVLMSALALCLARLIDNCPNPWSSVYRVKVSFSFVSGRANFPVALYFGQLSCLTPLGVVCCVVEHLDNHTLGDVCVMSVCRTRVL